MRPGIFSSLPAGYLSGKSVKPLNLSEAFAAVVSKGKNDSEGDVPLLNPASAEGRLAMKIAAAEAEGYARAARGWCKAPRY